MRILKKDVKSSENFKKISTKTNLYYIKYTRPELWFYWDNDEVKIERSLVFENGTEAFKLTDHFVNWQNPSQEEIIMFELQTGIKYIDYWLGLREE